MKIEINKDQLLTFLENKPHIESAADNFNTTKAVIVNRMKEFGITINQIKKSKHPSIIDEYLNGASKKALSKKYNMHETTISKILIEGNIDTVASKHRYVSINFFKNKELMYYVLGLVATDGCMRDSNGFNFIQIRISDLDVLEKIRDALYGIGSDKKITAVNPANKEHKIMYNLEIYDLKIYDWIVSKGVTPRKTYTLAISEDVISSENIYLNHFIRGLFDGDGWITTKGYFCGFCGASDFMPVLKEVLSSATKTTFKIKTKRKNIGNDGYFYQTYVCSMADVKKLMTFMYKDASIYMDRKANMFKTKNLATV